MTDDEKVEAWLRQLTDAETPEDRSDIYTEIQEKEVHLLGEVFMAVIEYQHQVCEHLTDKLVETQAQLVRSLKGEKDCLGKLQDQMGVEFPRDGKRLDLKDVEVPPSE